MKKSILLALLLALVFVAPAALQAQTRPRRTAGNEPAQTQTQSPQQPSRAPTPLPRASAPTAKRDAERTQEQTAEEVGEDEVVRVNATLVTVPVSVLDRDGRFIPGLRKDDFRIFEDGTEQQVAYFATTEEPFTVALVIDTSGSTRFKLEDIQDAAIAFLDQLRPADKVIVVSFDDSVRVLSEATSDRRQLRDAIRQTHTGGGTRLYDAVDLVIQKQLERARGRKAIVLFTDGVDTTSRTASFQSTVSEAEELDALIYPIQYDTYEGGGGGGGGGSWPGSPGGVGVLGKIAGVILGGGGVTIGSGGGGAGTSRGDYRRGSDYLHRLADATGGRLNNANDIRYLEEAFTNIAEELRRQYSLGYYPSRQAQASERRQIRVRVKRPNLVVRARDSYIYKSSANAPADSAAQQQPAAPQSAPVLRKHDFAGGTRE
ncbi:MAG: VWA domain-containing protein [Pyrinomonadaceae bacterium]